ncbi:MAG: hypothetical protein Q7R47_00515, partial [Candidatus Diapherotrites archaeon]|nr:hypothetical protein [Candidatus Diapherotrites archaeon]
RGNYFYNQDQKIAEIQDCPEIDSSIHSEHTLYEKNIFALTPRGPSDKQAQYSGMQYSGQKSILRLNVYYSNAGTPIQMSAKGIVDNKQNEAWMANHNRIYNNVFYQNALAAISITAVSTPAGDINDNMIKNNLFISNTYDHPYFQTNPFTGKPMDFLFERSSATTSQFFASDTFLVEHNDFFHSPAGQPVIAYAINGSTSLRKVQSLSAWETDYPNYFRQNLEVDPKVVNAAAHDFNLQSQSPLVDAGTFLAKAVGSGSGTTLVVDDAYPFFDGFGIDGEVGDVVQLQNSGQTARLTNVNYATNTLTLDASLSWTAGQGISLPYNGNAPDIGAVESLYSNTCSAQSQQNSCNTTTGCKWCSNACLGIGCCTNADCAAGQQCTNFSCVLIPPPACAQGPVTQSCTCA